MWSQELFFGLAKRVARLQAELVALVPNICLEERRADGKTPLIWVACTGNTELVKALVAAGADLEMRDSQGKTALIWAAWWGHSQTLDVLIKAGADIEARDDEQSTSLSYATQHGHSDAVNSLLANGANIYVQDGYGNIPNGFRPTKQYLVTRWQQQYQNLLISHTPPVSADEVYHLLSVYPLLDPKNPVDREAHMHQIFFHARWNGKDQVRHVVAQLCESRLNPAFGESLIALTDPASASILQPHGRGR
jgi:hypothetical protein